MFILIVGGGKVGSYLTRALLAQNHEVVVVEKQEKKARALELLLDMNVSVVGDGCDPEILRQAGIERADVVVADTGDDEDNLVVILIAKRQPNHPRCIARVNNPRNKMIFESLDPEDPVVVISSTEVILDVLNEHVNAPQHSQMLASMTLFDRANLELLKVTVPQDCSMAGKPLHEVAFPRNSVAVAIDRAGEDLVIPNSDTRIQPNDQVIVISKKGAAEAVRDALVGSASDPPKMRVPTA
ncbi:MAG: TrkA family potassium uptake protein [Candidatus Eremiobacteraeota bacterium]|nr:TrkA family potassium uptake protein [Candidatus Eremiobacteraeota bacterium]